MSERKKEEENQPFRRRFLKSEKKIFQPMSLLTKRTLRLIGNERTMNLRRMKNQCIRARVHHLLISFNLKKHLRIREGGKKSLASRLTMLF
jgi:hypothetical protein